jgi:hypothetical protein
MFFPSLLSAFASSKFLCVSREIRGRRKKEKTRRSREPNFSHRIAMLSAGPKQDEEAEENI